MAGNFNFNWQREPAVNPYMDTGDLATMMSNTMQGYRPNTAFTPNVPAAGAAGMAGYSSPASQMAGYRPNSLDAGHGMPNLAPNLEGYGQSLQNALDANIAVEQVEEIDRQIEENNAKIASLRQQLVDIKKEMAGRADKFDRALAANRARVGDLANAQTHLGRIETRTINEENRKSNERLRLLDNMSQRESPEYDDLMKLAKMRTNLEAVANEPGIRSGYEREYNMMVKQYTDKYGHAPDFSLFEQPVDLFMDRSGYKAPTDEDLSKDKQTLQNFITNNTSNGVWTAGDDKLKRAIKAAETQGDASLAKQLRNTWTPVQRDKYLSDMDKAGRDAMQGLSSREADTAKIKHKFTDKQGRVWEEKNGKWSSADYKWNGKRNGV